MKMSNTEKFKGIFVAMNSCYDASGEISVAAVKKFSRFLADSGVQGLYVGGSTGEGFLQTAEERMRVLEAVAEETGDELTLIAQVGAISTRESIALAKHAESVGADAISAVPPFYYKVSEEGVERHWQAMMDQCSLPFIIYHIPATTGYTLSMSLFRKMAAHKQVIGLKITTPSAYELQQFKRAGGENFIVFNGPDEQYLAGRIMGADAGIGGTYGIMPELFVKIEQAYAAGRLKEAQQWQFRVNEIIADLLALPVYGALKELLKMRGIDCGPPRLPIEPVSDSHLPQIRKIYDKLNHYLSLI